MEKHTFQVNLGGIIDILANHLYSEESVFIRELLQNATDAITARGKIERQLDPKIEIELINDRGAPSQLIISDNGIGLTETEVHAFLSVIGASSKKDSLLRQKEDFIGQFGIGLLSCFVVAEEIVMITQSQQKKQPVEWRGRSDGSYTIRLLEQPFDTGTRVFLTAKPGQEVFFEKNKLTELIARYGGFLKYPIFFTDNNRKPRRINKGGFPWEDQPKDAAKQKAALLEFGCEFFEMDCIACVPLFAAASGSTGFAFIGQASNAHQQQRHSVYLHRMFLSDKVDNILPEWVFFAKCIINSTGLRPTASRESFYEDNALKDTREQLGQCIMDYFFELKKSDPELLSRIIGKHHLAIKLAAVSNEDFFRNMYSFIPFETNFGAKTVADFFDKKLTLKYVTDVDEFRKIASVAFNQSITVVNAGYVYENAFFEKLSEFFPEEDVRHFDAAELMTELAELSLDERDATFDFLQLANQVLQAFDCNAELRHFLPAALSAIYFKNDEMDYLRKIQQTKDVSNELWGGILDNISADAHDYAQATVCFNFSNALVKKAVVMPKSETLAVLIKMLYVQALLTGRHPLQQKEMNLMTGGLHYLIDKVTENNG